MQMQSIRIVADHRTHGHAVGHRGLPLPGGTASLGPSQLASLAVLGIVHAGFGTMSQVVAAAQRLARADWQPTRDLLTDAVASALAEGCLALNEPETPSDEPSFVITQAGTSRLRALLRSSAADGGGSLGRALAALRICFLGALDPETGREVLNDLSRSFQDELETLRRARVSCPAAGGSAGLWIEREIERVEHELGWLERLRPGLGRAAARG